MNLKTTNTFLSVLSVVLTCALAVILLHRGPATSAGSSQIIEQPTRTQAENELKASFWNMYPSLIIPSEDRTVSDTITLTRDDGKNFSLKSLVNGKNKLIFRYSAYDCEVCVDSVLSIVELITQSKKADDFIIVTDSKTDRDFFIKSKDKKHPYPIYNIARSSLGLPFENNGLPFLFILTKNFTTSKYLSHSKK
ncbi:TlpA family protein disulfide reductase [Mucilaginibacter sp. UYCu711]|uniref:TlpA family protein disulfide reductase n=1 Tax=Mucilaginibacter sp. UYCu711 TaxID=3156339 RepID=UPI003D2161EA